MELLKQLDNSPLFALLLKGITALVTLYLLPKLKPATTSFIEWGKAKAGDVKNQYAAGVLQRLADLIGQKVLAAENTLIEDLKAAASDGQITKDELLAALAHVKATVIADVKATASAQGLLVAALTLFKDDDVALTKYIGDLLETFVAKLPASGLQTPKYDGETAAIDVAKLTDVAVAAALPTSPR